MESVMTYLVYLFVEGLSVVDLSVSFPYRLIFGHFFHIIVPKIAKLYFDIHISIF